MTINSLEKLLVDELKDLMGAEKQILVALPKMAAAANSDELREAFETHEKQTRGHVERLEQAFAALEEKVASKKCKGMAGLLEEGNERIEADMSEPIRDAALIGAAQRVEHYEMAAYGAARDFAKQIGRLDVAQLLQANLDEEGDTDRLLTQIAEFAVNIEAAQAPVGAG
jgi:ferritin-like metal-binding protein YciE